ncbi:hypothetical protein DFQ28_002509 [Apophysomyces sp. BC1034]|nr:hypothetical protein DFQ30_002895 [Apophysomyces sp. BC1015]KAG0179636.1 hypothetical protein DFQ29_001837 [Apophysomyces sp. BC1021]KAG0190067.1 hypothetical protein DFQ28_002509 [Apophysomyces sp. BC1034]
MVNKKQKLQEQIARLQNEIEELQLEREESKKNVLHFMEEAESARQALQKTQHVLDELTHIQGQNDERRVIIAGLAVKLCALPPDHVDRLLSDQKDEQVDRLTTQLNEAVDQAASLQVERDNLCKELDQQRQEHEATRRALQVEQDRAEVLEKRWEDSESGLEQAESRVQSLEREVERWREKSYGVSSPTTTTLAAAVVNDDSAKLQELEDRYRSRFADLEIKLNAGEKDRAALQEKHDQLEAELTEYQTFHDQQKELEQARIRENHINGINKTLREELRKSQQNQDDVINMQYLKNVILKFLERKQTRTNANWNKGMGKAKETAGNMFGNERMEAEGQSQNAGGQAEGAAAKAQDYLSGMATQMKAKVTGAMDTLSGNQTGQAQSKAEEMKGAAKKKWNE